jgi:hypothetical protein
MNNDPSHSPTLSRAGQDYRPVAVNSHSLAINNC